MKLIFLDIDGVLNTHDFCPDAKCGSIHREKVQLLNSVLVKTGAKIVVSSAWRYLVYRGEMDLTGLGWLLRSHGLHADRIVGITGQDDYIARPNWDGSTEWVPTYERGNQIAAYLAANPAGRYAVIDDLDLGISAAGHPFIHTDGKIGLTEEHADELVRILGTNKETA